MAIRVLFILLSIFILVNIVILLVSCITGVNLYQKHGTAIWKGYGIFILFIVALYTVLAIIGLV